MKDIEEDNKSAVTYRAIIDGHRDRHFFVSNTVKSMRHWREFVQNKDTFFYCHCNHNVNAKTLLP